MATNVAFFVDVKRCAGCRGCQVACKAENNTRPRANPTDGAGYLGEFNYRRVVSSAPGRTASPAPVSVTRSQVRRFVSTACYHCKNPACVAVCPGRAIYKRASDGVVLINYNKCLGCRSCQFACPYSAPQFNTIAHRMQKCTFCEHRLAAGLKPACVQTCSAKALRSTGIQADGSTILPVARDSSDVTPPPPEGRHGGDTNFANKVYKRDAGTYATYVGTSSSRHASTVPQVLFTE